MVCNSLNVSLDGHCIETEVKNEFRRMMNCFFDNDNSPELLASIEFLRDFIDKADFAELRASDERLIGNPPSIVSLRRENGVFIVTAVYK